MFWRPRKRVSPPGDQPILNESQIHSGDFIGVIRLDGLDPVLAFGMGSHTGHTAVALWEETWLVDVTTIVGGVFFSDVLPGFQNFRLLKLLYSLCLFFSFCFPGSPRPKSKDGQLYIAESTVNGSYWWGELGFRDESA